MGFEQSPKMIHATQEAKLFRPIHEAVTAINEKYPNLSVRFTADTLTELENLPVQLETQNGISNLGGWRLISCESKANLDEHLVLIKGDITGPQPIPVRIHSSFMVNEVVHIAASDDRIQLHTAMQQIYAIGRGIILYIYQEGAGNRLSSAVAQLALTNMGIPMTDAFEMLGIQVDNRSFHIAADILKMLEVTAPIALMTNNVKKRQQLESAGFQLAPYDFTVQPTDDTTRQYLEAKKQAGLYENR